MKSSKSAHSKHVVGHSIEGFRRWFPRLEALQHVAHVKHDLSQHVATSRTQQEHVGTAIRRSIEVHALRYTDMQQEQVTELSIH